MDRVRIITATVLVTAVATVGLSAWPGAPVAAEDAPRHPQAATARVDPFPSALGVVVVTGPAAGDHGSSDLYRHTDDGLVRITHNAYDAEEDFQPSSFAAELSPDGTRLVYVHCDLEDGASVCRPHVMDSDGTDDVVVDDPALIDPPLGLDFGGGGEIAYATDGVLYAFSPASGRRTISDHPDLYWQAPSWNPDGTALAVEGLPKDPDGDPMQAEADIWSIGADGSGAVNLTNTPDPIFTLTDFAPLWSTDGSRISWVNDSEYGGYQLSMMDADGTNARQLSVDGPFDPGVHKSISPLAWSQSSSYLAYRVHRPGETRLGYVKANGPAVYVGLLDLPDGFVVDDWAGEPAPSDVAVRVRGYRDDARVGEAEPVLVTVTNRGPEPAVSVGLLVSDAPGTHQTWVRWRGPHRGWDCQLSSKAELWCWAPSLAAGASVTLELGVLATRRSDAARLTVTVGARSRDLPGNNRRSPVQVIEHVERPPSPDRDRAGWHRVDRRHDYWVRADDVVYEEASPGERLPGWYGATLWGWAPHQEVFRLRFKNRACPSGVNCSGIGLGEGDCLFGLRDHCHTITGGYVWSRQDWVQRATWRFFPGDATDPLPAVSYQRELPR